MIKAFHGIGAYRGQRSPMGLLRMAQGCIGHEICVADRPIGAFGSIVYGECTALFNRDVFSCVVDGMRVVDTDDNNFVRCGATAYLLGDNAYQDRYLGKSRVVGNIDQKLFDRFCRLNNLGGRSYKEGWLIPELHAKFWVKDWADEKTKKAAKLIASLHGVELITVSGTDRIWEDKFKTPISFGKINTTIAAILAA